MFLGCQEMLGTIETVADLSYAWHALEGYKEDMGQLLATSPESVKGLRALFLKLASILEVPLRRSRRGHAELAGLEATVAERKAPPCFLLMSTSHLGPRVTLE